MHAILQDSSFFDDLREPSCTIYITKGYQDFSFTMFWYIEPFNWYKTYMLLNINDQYEYSAHLFLCFVLKFHYLMMLTWSAK